MAGKVLDPLPVDSWPGAVQAQPALRTSPALHHVLDRAKEELFRDAGIALQLADAVMPHATEPVLRGRALRLRAHALHQMTDLDGAKASIHEALSILGDEPAGALELLQTRLLDAYVRNQTEDGDVLMEVRVVAKAFADYGDAAGVLMARITEANILFERDQFARAMTVYQNALQIAEKLEDERNTAITLANLGHCAQQLSLAAHKSGVALRAYTFANEAIAFFARATPLYARLGMDAESQKIVWAMAVIAQTRGNLAEARAQLLRVYDDLLGRQMFLPAALVALDLMELLVKVDRRDLIASWYEEVEQTFIRAGMPKYAVAALSRVQTAAQKRPIDAPFFAEARAAMRDRFKKAA